MKKNDFATIAVRLLALYIIVMAANALPNYFGMIGSNVSMDPTIRAVVVSGIIGTVSHFIVGFGLWVFSASLANLITKNLSETPQTTEDLTLDRI